MVLEIFGGEGGFENYLPGLALNDNPPDLNLSIS
jgi:hypothetical protein